MCVRRHHCVRVVTVADNFIVARNINTRVFPLFELYVSQDSFGSQISSIPFLVSRFDARAHCLVLTLIAQ